MKRLTLALAAATLACAVPGLAAQPQKPEEVHAQGCVEPGIQPHCLMMKDLKSGKLYNLLFKEMAPAVGDGIEVVGVLHSGPTACMQGVPLDVASWTHRNSLRCKPGPAPRK